MKYLLVFALFLLKGGDILAQTSKKVIAGVYNLQGVMETASGFKLMNDGRFQFFYSQGAVDQYGEGKWKKENNHIVFNSLSLPGNDFKLVNSKKAGDTLVTVKINDANTLLLPYVVCTVVAENGYQELQIDSKGIAIFKSGRVKKIRLMHKFWPQRTSEFVINSADNYFEFSILSTIAQVYFSNFKLNFEGRLLKGKHPLLQGANYTYTKE